MDAFYPCPLIIHLNKLFGRLSLASRFECEMSLTPPYREGSLSRLGTLSTHGAASTGGIAKLDFDDLLLVRPGWRPADNFYGGFAIVGGLAQIIGLISTSILLFLLRRRRTAFVLTLIAALSFAGMLALFAFGNNPLNQQIATWTPQSLPANWHEIGDAWDRFHAASSGFAVLAFTVLLIALLRETPSSLSLRETSRERAKERLAR